MCRLSAVSYTHLLDSDSPVRVRGILSEIDPRTTLFIVSSKSGGTIEPRLALRAVRDALADQISDEEMVQHLVAITDPGSKLEQQAREEGWAAVFSGEPTVGGRFSALSVFGLLDVYKRQVWASTAASPPPPWTASSWAAARWARG